MSSEIISYKNELLNLKEIERKIQCEKSYYEFSKDAFEVLHNKQQMTLNWHIKYLCDVIQECVVNLGNGNPKLYDLSINIPPRTLKTILCSVNLCPWTWIKYPWIKFMNTSYAGGLSMDHNTMARDIIRSRWYQERWGTKFSIKNDQDTKTHFTNDKYGERQSTSVDGTFTGKGCDILVVDDVLNPSQAASEAERTRAINYVKSTLQSRINKPGFGFCIYVSQRLHEEDVTGYILNSKAYNIRHICIPADDSLNNIEPPFLRKYYKNGIFFPARLPRSELNTLKNKMGSFLYTAQYLQSPIAAGGNIFKRKWFKFYNKLPQNFDHMIQSWDCSFKDAKTSSFVVGQVLGRIKANIYLIEQIRKQMGFVETIESILYLSKKYPRAFKKYIEEKANGIPAIETLHKKVGGIIGVKPIDDKISRASAESAVVEAGNFYLPCISDPTDYNSRISDKMPAVESWVEEYIRELCAFPNSSFDDQVDATTQGIMKIKESLSVKEITVKTVLGKSLTEMDL